MVITAPTRLRSYSADVSATVSFTRSLCSTFTRASATDDRGFTTKLELVECSRSVVDPQGQDCQAPTEDSEDAKSKRVWFSQDVPSLYRRPSFSVTLNCSVWGQSGTFRLFLRTNLSHAAVVARSDAVQVKPSQAFKVSFHRSN